MVVAKDWGEKGNEDLVFNEDRLSVWNDENIRGDERWWWLLNNVNVLNATELYALKWLKW